MRKFSLSRKKTEVMCHSVLLPETHPGNHCHRREPLQGGCRHPVVSPTPSVWRVRPRICEWLNEEATEGSADREPRNRHVYRLQMWAKKVSRVTAVKPPQAGVGSVTEGRRQALRRGSPGSWPHSRGHLTFLTGGAIPAGCRTATVGGRPLHCVLSGRGRCWAY